MTAVTAPATADKNVLKSAWPVLLPFLLLATPTVVDLSNQTWNSEAGAHGPIILAAGGWLIWRRKDELATLSRPGRLSITILGMLACLACYVVGREVDLITLEAGGLYGAGLFALYGAIGLTAMRAIWFPLFYLAFAVPPPTYWLEIITVPLKDFVSLVSTGALHALGMPVSREGVTIFVAQYQLLVEDACSGMNSLIGLTAISLLYVYLRRGSSPMHSLVLLVMVIPIAIVANILRIMTLILVTYFMGDQWGESALHPVAGLFLFSIALLLVFSIDELISVVGSRARRRA